MNKRLLSLLLFLAVFGHYSAPLARADGEFNCLSPVAEEEQKKMLAQVEQHYQQFSDLKARFTQQSYFVGLNQRVTSKGQVWFKKPGMMDWNYEEPDAQRFVADGKTLWFYQPELNQVTLGDFKAAFDSDLPVSFLLGVGRLQENFSLRSACVSSGGVVLSLIPAQADPNLQEFYLLVDKAQRTPLGAKIIDVGGNETAIVFADIAYNVKLSDSQFSFVIPHGADIIDKRRGADPSASGE